MTNTNSTVQGRTSYLFGLFIYIFLTKGGAKMAETCAYKGRTPMDNLFCLRCSLFLETCIPIAGNDGFSNGECDVYLCESCTHHDCFFCN